MQNKFEKSDSKLNSVKNVGFSLDITFTLIYSNWQHVHLKKYVMSSRVNIFSRNICDIIFCVQK